MAMSITRPAAMTAEEAEKMSEEIRRGAVVRVEDPRFSKVINFVWAALGGLALTGIGTIISGQSKTNESIAKINENIAIMVQRQNFNDRINDQQDEHLRSTDAKVDRNSDRLSILERSMGLMGGGRRAN